MMNYWMAIATFSVLMFWGTGCAANCSCFTGCNYCSDLGGANLTFVVGGVTAVPLCTDTTWCDPINATHVVTAPVGTIDCGLTPDYIGNCMCDREPIILGRNNCLGLGPPIRDLYVFSGALNASSGMATIKMKLDVNAFTGVGYMAIFSYQFAAPVNCDVTNGPFTMTLDEGNDTNTDCDGTAATATVQIGP